MALTAICKFTSWEVQATWNGIMAKQSWEISYFIQQYSISFYQLSKAVGI